MIASSCSTPSKSSAYMCAAIPICFRLLMHAAALAFCFAFAIAGNNSPARIAITVIIIAVYIVYSLWDYLFLALLSFSSMLDYFVGVGIARQTDPRRRKLWLVCSLVANLTILGFFKYCDFFILSFAAVMKQLHIHV